MVGIALTALITGVVFSRFATAGARVIFSQVAVVHTFDGKRTLLFRMCNARATAIVEATVHVYLSREEKTVEGDGVRRIHDIELRRNNTPVFALSWSVYHVLDESSPLYGATAESFNRSTASIIVTFQGIDDRLAATIHTRYLYNAEDVLFADIIKVDPTTSVRYLDFEAFHTTEPIVDTAAA